MVFTLFVILVLAAVVIAAQTTQVRKELPPIVAIAPITAAQVDTTALAEERAKTALQARKTAIVRNDAWKAVIKEYRATKDSLAALRATDAVPGIMAVQY